LQGQVNQLPCGIELHRCFPWIITDRSRRGVKPVRQGDKTLRDPVVYVAGKASSFDFLSLDNLLDEALVRAFSSDELAMQPRLMQCPGNQATNDRQQIYVGLGELASLYRVHGQLADESAGACLHRHRHHRREFRIRQCLDGDVARVGLLSVDDHNGAPVAGNPAGNT
jgi:hypothetical protein